MNKKYKKKIQRVSKKQKFCLGLLILFCVFVLGNFYTKDAYAVHTYVPDVYAMSAPLKNGTMIEQEFSIGEADQGVQILVGTYKEFIENGSGKASLYDENNHKVAETTVSLIGHMDEEYVNFYFGNIPEELVGQKCTVRFWFSDLEKSARVYYTVVNSEQYTAYLNGIKQEHIYIVNGIEEATYLEYRDVRWFYLFPLSVFVLYVVLYKKEGFKDKRKQTIKRLEVLWHEKSLSILTMIGIMCGSGMCAKLLELFWSNGSYENPYRMFAIFVFLFIVSTLCVFRNKVWQNMHSFIFVIIVMLGGVYVTGTPVAAVGWDEAHHYTQTAYMSYGATAEISKADEWIKRGNVYLEHENIYARLDRQSWKAQIDSVDSDGEMVRYAELVSINSISYIPASVVLWLSRILGVNFSTRWVLGRMTNLCIYAWLIAMSVKCLKDRGKLLVSVIGLIPTNLVLASSYGYDWWLGAFVILGYAVFIGEVQEKNIISTKRLVYAVLAASTGMLIKAVYFPLLLPMMLLRKERYQDAKKARLIVLSAMLLLLLSFVVPMFMNMFAGAASGGGDIRGGINVNASGQIVYILNHLGEYIKVLLSELISYLNPDQAAEYLTMMASQGIGEYYTVCLLVLGVVAMLDNSTKTCFASKEPLVVGGGYMGIFGTLVLVVTVMYVTYTEVGANWVFGCQLRYILPVLFPFLFFVGENKMEISDQVKGKLFCWGTVSMALIYLWTCYQVFIIKY